MRDTFDRALLLYEQSRYDLAEQELQIAMAAPACLGYNRPCPTSMFPALPPLPTKGG